VIAITAEDAERHKSYKDNLVRQDLEKQSDNIEDFLLGLEMVAESGQVGPTTLTRVTQLINKTNQFNLTTRRYTEEQVRTMSEAPDWWTRWFRLKDKFGDHGLIGVILAKKSGGIWDIDTWLMSCRVLGRNMEKFMLADLVGSALKDSASAISGVYIPTAKNILVDKLYANLGFQPESRANHFVLQLKERNTPPCEFIRSATSS
jgi:FkbH-like protein